MKIGITSVENAAVAAKLGCDYLEVNASAIASLSEEGFEKEWAAIQSCGLPAECANVLFGDIRLLGEEGAKQAAPYLRAAFERLQKARGQLQLIWLPR